MRQLQRVVEVELSQSWNRSGSPAPVRPDRTRSDKTGRKFHPVGRNRIFSDFFAGLFAGFLPDFCQIGVKNHPVGFRPDRTGQILKLAGPDRMQKIRPVPTLSCRTLTQGLFLPNTNR
jgi:hypothetical protein